MKPGKFLYRAFLFSISFFLLFGKRNSFSQGVDVDLFTGAVYAKIPIYNVQSGDISVPLVLFYNNNGIKVEDITQYYGIGWNMTGEVSVSRILRGFPDDVQYQGGSTFSVIYGWLRATGIGNAVQNFSVVNDNNPNTCNDEVTDYNNLSGSLGEQYDTEPDIFSVNLPGGGFDFVFDKDGVIRVSPYRDIKVEYTTDLTGILASFTVTDENGVKYVFDQISNTQENIDDNISPSALNAFKRDFIFFRRKTSDNPLPLKVNYGTTWYVSTITDTKGNKIIFTYEQDEPGPDANTTEAKKIIKYNSSVDTYSEQTLYTRTKTNYVKRIKKIQTYSPNTPQANVDDVEFTWDTQYKLRLNKIKLVKSGQQVEFLYRLLLSGDGTTFDRFFLQYVSFNRGLTCDPLAFYEFKYNGVDMANATGYCNSAILNAQDYWGYHNGITANSNLFPTIWVYPDNSSVEKFRITPIPNYSGTVVQIPASYPGVYGADRSPGVSAINGSLYRIIYPAGGYSQIEYENNVFLDPDFNGAATGGGIRVKKITHNDGLNTNEIINYSYNDPVTSVTTGRALSMPNFMFAFPNTTSYSGWPDKVKNATYRSSYSLSEEPANVIYGKVTVQKTGAGKTVYEFNTDGTWRSAAAGDWNESMIYVGRHYTSQPNPCNPIIPVFLANDKNKYPFPVNTNYDFQRGLLNKVTHYNESGTPVMEESYAYQRSHALPIVIKGLKYDDLYDVVKSVRAYSKYDILTVVGNLSAAKTVKTYNSSNPGPTVYTTETENIYYESANHKLATKISKQNSDGTTYRTMMKYIKDYSTTGTGDDYEKAIHNLKLQNINAPVETYQSGQVSGGSEKVTSAAITRFKPFVNGITGLNMYLPADIWVFNSTSGITNFTQSSISGGTLSMYSGYIKEMTVDKYGTDGRTITGINEVGRINNTALYSSGEKNKYKIAEVANAKWNEIGFSNFDEESVESSFSSSGGVTVIQPGRASNNAMSFQSGQNFNKTIYNASTNSKIIFSVWLKDAAAAGNLTINIACTGCGTIQYTVPFTTGSDWKYYEFKFNKPSGSSYVFTLTTSATVKIDDIMVYPDNAGIKINSYTSKTYGTSGLSNTLLTAETGLNGSARFYEYDNMGRLLIIKDQDNNIVEAKTYKRVNAWPSATAPISVNPNPALVNEQISFANYGFIPLCYTGSYFKWNFGDGSAEVNTTANTVYHTYATAGTYTVSCTPFIPGYTNVVLQVSTANVQVNNQTPPIYPVICAAGITEQTDEGDCILSYCSPLSAVCTSTKFKLNSITNGSLNDVQSVTWQKAPYGTENWTTAGTGTQITITFHPVHTTSYKMRAQVVMNDGRQGTSNIINVMNYMQ